MTKFLSILTLLSALAVAIPAPDQPAQDAKSIATQAPDFPAVAAAFARENAKSTKAQDYIHFCQQTLEPTGDLLQPPTDAPASVPAEVTAEFATGAPTVDTGPVPSNVTPPAPLPGTSSAIGDTGCDSCPPAAPAAYSSTGTYSAGNDTTTYSSTGRTYAGAAVDGGYRTEQRMQTRSRVVTEQVPVQVKIPVKKIPIYEDQVATKFRTVNETVMQTEQRTRMKTVQKTRQVPVTVMKTEAYTEQVPETYSVSVPKVVQKSVPYQVSRRVFKGYKDAPVENYSAAAPPCPAPVAYSRPPAPVPVCPQPAPHLSYSVATPPPAPVCPTPFQQVSYSVQATPAVTVPCDPPAYSAATPAPCVCPQPAPAYSAGLPPCPPQYGGPAGDLLKKVRDRKPIRRVLCWLGKRLVRACPDA